MYLVGCLYKLVCFVFWFYDEDILLVLKVNLNSVVIVVFFCFLEYFIEEELFLSIVGLFFSGDFRMVVGEDRSKI